MKYGAKEIIGNTALVLVGKVSTSVITLATFLVLAKQYSVEQIGLYVFLAGIVTMFSVVGNWGTNEYILKEGAANPDSTVSLIRASFWAKGAVGICAGCLGLLALPAVGYPSNNILIFVAVLGFVFFDSLTMTLITALRAGGNNKFEAFFFPSRNLMRFATVIWLVFLQQDLFVVLLAMMVVNAVGFVFSHIYCFSRIGAVEDFKDSMRKLGVVLKAATPFALLSVIGIGYTKADQIMLGFFKSDREVGIYAIAWQVYEVALFLPLSFRIVILPRLVRTFKIDAQKWSKQVLTGFKWSILTGAVIGTVLFIGAPLMLQLIFGTKYMQSENVVRVLIIAYMVRFPWAVIITSMLVSSENVKWLNVFFISTFILNLGSNLFAIPLFGAIGAAYSTLASELCAVIMGSAWFFRNRALICERTR